MYLNDNFPELPPNFFDTDILPKMKYHAALTLHAIKKKLNPNRRRACYELFGYDYIIDGDFNVWLIECNTNPCLEESSSMLAKLLKRMINDSFKLTLDVAFPPIS